MFVLFCSVLSNLNSPCKELIRMLISCSGKRQLLQQPHKSTTEGVSFRKDSIESIPILSDIPKFEEKSK